ncbi:MBL fold metallo-hydrolase [Desulfovibrio sp. OttesenSCG-928-C06]|nr:MBL fold metallo-hydrolase [Desulfovibrio sp. OttesenSCG-928-C06]
MKVVLLGAAQTVTGSCYMIETGDVRFGIDCGMHQGNKEIEKRNYETELYIKPRLDFFLITHAHIDHSGLLPRMAREGFSGPVYCTEPTADLLEIMLLDSAHIQEMEATWENTKLARKGSKQVVQPLYEQKDAEHINKMLKPIVYNVPFSPAPGVTVTYRDAGHILGAAFLEVEVQEAEGTTKLIFSGDLGRPDALLLNDPASPKLRKPDYLFIESTYGDREHKNIGDSRAELAEAIAYSHGQGGKVVIPAFAVERTQEVLYSLYMLRKEGKLPDDMPVFVDSPLAIRATEIFRKYPHYTDEDTRKLLAANENPLDLPNLRFTLSTEESQAINAYEGPAIIISASGMCNAGRIKHHLRHNIWNPKCSVVFVGYQGVGTPGRKIVDGAKEISLFGEDLAINARIFTINGFSAHAGQGQILDWVGEFVHDNMTIFLMHGEFKKQEVLASRMRELFQAQVQIPAYLEELTLAPGKEPMVQVDGTRSLPKVNWHRVLSDSESKLSAIREHFDLLSTLPWEQQTELRDEMLEINKKLLTFLTRI